jgi:hypothetical protein
MEELDECSFLCGGMVGCDRSGFLWVISWMNPKLLCITSIIESLIWQGSTYIYHAKGLSNFVELLVAGI